MRRFAPTNYVRWCNSSSLCTAFGDNEYKGQRYGISLCFISAYGGVPLPSCQGRRLSAKRKGTLKKYIPSKFLFLWLFIISHALSFPQDTQRAERLQKQKDTDRLKSTWSPRLMTARAMTMSRPPSPMDLEKLSLPCR